MKSLKNRLRRSKKLTNEFLSIKEINKKVKEFIPIKEKDKDKEKDKEIDVEYNLVLILKSLKNILNNSSRNIFSSVDSLKNELNYIDIEAYLNQFHSKPYFKYKIYPLLEILKETHLKNKKEKAFLHSAKEMNITINEQNKITESQIDCLNYMLIFQYERLLLLENNVFEIFVYLKDIFSYLKGDYKYLLDYYLLIQLHTYSLLGIPKFKENQKNNNDKKKYISISKILFDIIYKTNNPTLLELAFILFCQHYLYFRDNSFIFLPINKWVFLILKFLKGEIDISFDDSKGKDYYSLSKVIHSKYILGEIQRNKKREKSSESNIISALSNEDIPIKQRISFPPANLKSFERNDNIFEYLEDFTYESFPKKSGLSKGPSEIFIINLFKYCENEKENKKKNKEEYYFNKKMELIQGALIIADKILKFNYDKKEYKDFDEKYFCMKLFDEVYKLYLKYDELHIIKRCINNFGSILLKCPNYIIEYIPKIITRLSENALIGKSENLVNQLNYFFQNFNFIFQKAFDENDINLIKKINKITKDNVMMRSIVLLNPFIFKLKILKLNTKFPHEKIFNNIQSLINNYFIFCSTLVHNALILNNYILSIYIEVIIIYLIEKSSPDLIRKYMIKIITKIYREKLVNRILNFLIVDENGNLKLKILFYILRHISSDKYNRNNLPYLIKFLEKNNKINKSSSSKILEFIAKYFINKGTKFYLVDFYKDKNFIKNSSNELNFDENEYVEIYDALNPKSNEKIFKFIMKIFFQCLTEYKELDDISNIQKILSMIFINMGSLEQNNIKKLFEFFVDYLNNITQMIILQGHKIWQNYFKQYLEILNYANYYIIIKNNNFKEINKNDQNYIESLTNSYNKIILSLFKLIPNNLSSKDYEILNIIPIIYSILVTLDNLTVLNNQDKKDNLSNNNETNISYELLNIINKYLSNKTKSTFNSCNISLFYIFYYLKNISKKEYFDIIYNIIIRSLNIEEFKYENNATNAVNFILIKLCVKILYSEKEYITKEEDEVLSFYDKKYQLIQKLHEIIKKNLEDDNKNNDINSINSIEGKESIDEGTINTVEQNFEKKIELIKKYIIFNSNSNFIDINMDKYNEKDEIKNIIIEKYKETKDIVSCRYQKWLIFMEMLSNSKSKKSLTSSDMNENIDFLLNSSFSFSENKPIHFVSLIKSLELENEDLNLFSNFLAILGNIIINENEIVFKNESIFENTIYKFDKFILYGVVFVLIKKYFEEFDAHFSCNFIVFIKPLRLKGIYMIKIQKNSDFKMKNNNAFKLLTQIDQDFNKIFSDFIILDTKNQKQISYFNNLIEMIFNYSFLEEQINNS